MRINIKGNGFRLKGSLNGTLEQKMAFLESIGRGDPEPETPVAPAGVGALIASLEQSLGEKGKR